MNKKSLSLQITSNDIEKNPELKNMGLVFKVARSLYSIDNHNLEFNDMINAGYQGLQKAYKIYDESRGKFSTLAWKVIKQEINRYVAKNRVFKVPYIYSLENSRLKKRGKVSEKFQKILDTKKNIREKFEHSQKIVSMERKSIDNNSIEQKNTEICTEYNDKLYKCIAKLKDKEQLIIKNRFGIDCEKKKLEELGSLLGVTRERVRQIESSSLLKLRHLMEEKCQEHEIQAMREI